MGRKARLKERRTMNITIDAPTITRMEWLLKSMEVESYSALLRLLVKREHDHRKSQIKARRLNNPPGKP